MLPPMTMTLETFLIETVVILAAAIGVLLASHRLRIPPIVGYLLTGVMIGPSGLALIPDTAQVELFAEIGVVLLLFSIGLEFSPSRLRHLRRPFLIGGSVQVGVATAAGTVAALGLGFKIRTALFLGFVVALSSTAIVLKLYSDRRELETPQGRQSIGTLLFQDFMVVPMIALVPVLAGERSAPIALIGRFVLSLVILIAVFFVGRYLLPRLLHELVRTRIREVILLTSLLMCLGLALLTEHFHFSLALGAFLAGILLSESEYSAQVIADVGPLRDLFTSFFFVSIGMLPRLEFVASHLLPIIGLTALLIATKAIAASAGAAATGLTRRPTLIVGASLAHIGEFSFVILKLGRDQGLVDGDTLQMVVASAVLSMLATPLLVASTSRFTLRAVSSRGGDLHSDGTDRSGHVIIAGYGAAGRHLSDVLETAGIPFVVVDLNHEVVRGAQRDGRPMIFGDSTQPEILERAGIERAQVLVLALSDDLATQRTAQVVRAIEPSVHIVARTGAIAQIQDLHQAGADEVIADEFETSIEMLTRVLHRYHVPRNVIRAQTRALRGESYRMLRVPTMDSKLGERLIDILAAGTADVFHIAPGTPASGCSLGELDLRARTGATVIAVVRGEIPFTNPGPDFELQAGDEIVLVGGHGEIETAFRLLEGDADPSAPQS